jgi:hypothetical protein
MAGSGPQWLDHLRSVPTPNHSAHSSRNRLEQSQLDLNTACGLSLLFSPPSARRNVRALPGNELVSTLSEADPEFWAWQHLKSEASRSGREKLRAIFWDDLRHSPRIIGALLAPSTAQGAMAGIDARSSLLLDREDTPVWPTAGEAKRVFPKSSDRGGSPYAPHSIDGLARAIGEAQSWRDSDR